MMAKRGRPPKTRPELHTVIEAGPDRKAREAMRFTLIDTRHDYESPWMGMVEVSGNNGLLMLQELCNGHPHWYDLPLHGTTWLRNGFIKVVRVK